MIEKEFESQLNQQRDAEKSTQNSPMMQEILDDTLVIGNQGEKIEVFDLLMNIYDYTEAVWDKSDNNRLWDRLSKIALAVPLSILLVVVDIYLLNLLPFKDGAIPLLKTLTIMLIMGLSLGLTLELKKRLYLHPVKRFLNLFNKFRQKEEKYYHYKDKVYAVLTQKEVQYQYMAQLEYRRLAFIEQKKQIALNSASEENVKFSRLVKSFNEEHEKIILCFSGKHKHYDLEKGMECIREIEHIALKIKELLREMKVLAHPEESLAQPHLLSGEYVSGYEEFLDKHNLKEKIRQNVSPEKDDNVVETHLIEKIRNQL